MFIITFLLFINILVVSFFVAYHLFFIILYPLFKLFENKKEYDGSIEKYNRFGIIVPAHNEEVLIEKVIESIQHLEYPETKYELIIVADNCNDRTEEIAKSKDIKCFVRNDLKKRGKPFALEWIFKQIHLDDYDAFTIIDADTLVDKNYLKVINIKLNNGAKAIQGFFGMLNPEDDWLTRLMIIPGILKFKIRYFGKTKLGLSCPLMGNGMCFTKSIIKKYGWNAFSITENWEYYIKLLLNNHITNYAGNAIIYSHAVTSLTYGVKQRKRWSKGRLGNAIKYFPVLLFKSLKDQNPIILDAIVELFLPSYSMLFNWTIVLLLIVIILLACNLIKMYFIIWLLILLSIQFFHFIFGLLIAKASLKTWLSLVYVPIFLLWKFFVTTKVICDFKNNKWEKTDRYIN